MSRSILLFSFLFLMVVVSCNNKAVDTAEGEAAQTYTCPMHPQIVQNAPGQCPICGMDLVAFQKGSADATLMLSPAQRLLANVVTDTVRAGSFSSARQLNGRLAVNPESIEMISSRVPGRIETLFVRETGVAVRKGQPVYSVYSEQLAALQQEYLVALAQAESFPGDAKFGQIMQAARQRLSLFDQTAAQIQTLTTTRKTSPFITYTSPVSGVVSELFTSQGQYVAEGSPVTRIEGYESVWVEADIYPSEAGSVRVGQVVKVRVAGFEGEQQQMRIEFMAPALQSASQLMTARGRIANPGNRFRAGMQAVVEVPVTNLSDAITLPVDAVIRDGKGTHVWLEKEPGIFEARTITTGAENSSSVAVSAGLAPGEVVVVSGAYLLYSEFILKKGATPAGGHQH